MAHPSDFLAGVQKLFTSVQPPAWLVQEVQNRIILSLNHVLQQEPQAMERLARMGLTYHCRCTRGDIKAALSAPQEGAPMIGPDGPVYPGLCRHAGHGEGAIRLDMAKAMALAGDIRFTETGVDAGDYHYDAARMIEGVGDIVEILIEIEMIFLDVGDDGDSRMEVQEAGVKLTGFHDEGVMPAHARAAADIIQLAADMHGGIKPGIDHDFGDHGSGGGFAVRAADVDGVAIALHELPQQRCALHLGMPSFSARMRSGLSFAMAAE